MAVKSFLRFFWSLFKTNISNVYSLRANFWIEMISMMVNNCFFVVTWLILFNSFQEINGWGINHMILMLGTNMCAYGIYAFCFRGTADWLAGYIDRGELDTFILQPKNILLNVAGSKCSPSALGDFAVGLLFILFSGFANLSAIPFMLLSIITGFLAFLSVGIFIGSIGFYSKGTEGWGMQIMNIFLSISTQPGSIYTGWVKTMLLFVIPAGVLTFLPVEIIINPTWSGVLTMVSITAIFFCASVWFFYHGLRRYESGNSFGVRG